MLVLKMGSVRGKKHSPPVKVHYSLGVRIILRHDLSAVPDADDNTQALS